MREKGAGFSLVELLVILGIVGILVAIAVPTTNRSMLNLSYSMGEFESNVRVARGMMIHVNSTTVMAVDTVAFNRNGSRRGAKR